MHYLKSVILGLLGGLAVIGLSPVITIIIIFAGFLGEIKEEVE